MSLGFDNFSFSKNIELFFSISEIMTGNQESICVFYLQQLSDSSLGVNAFKTPWGSLILKNCNSDGALYTFKSIKEYKEVRKQYWLYMTLKVFRYRDHAFPIVCCSECENMKTVENSGLYADPCKISKMQCLHSKAAGFLVRNWNQIWKIELEDSDTAFAVFCNKEVKQAELGCDNFPSVAFCLAWPMLKPNTKFALNGPLTETSNHPE